MSDTPSISTKRLLRSLKGHLKFNDVDHARFQITNDESAWQANVLTFTYRRETFFAHVGSAEIHLTRPGGFAKERSVGKPVSLDEEFLADEIAKAIDKAKLQ